MYIEGVGNALAQNFQRGGALETEIVFFHKMVDRFLAVQIGAKAVGVDVHELITQQ